MCGGGIGEHGCGMSVMKDRGMGVMCKKYPQSHFVGLCCQCPSNTRALCLTKCQCQSRGA